MNTNEIYYDGNNISTNLSNQTHMRIKKCSFIRRAIASVIDFIAVILLGCVVLYVQHIFSFESTKSILDEVMQENMRNALMGGVALFMYGTTMQLICRRTLGKIVCKSHIVDYRGKVVSPFRGLYRAIWQYGFLLATVVISIMEPKFTNRMTWIRVYYPIINCAFILLDTYEGRALYDRIARTKVVVYEEIDRNSENEENSV